MVTTKVKLIGAAVAAGLIFGLGWKVNGWRLNAKFAKTQAAVIANYEERQRQLNEEAAEQARVDEAARLALSRDLEESRARTTALETELESIQLTPVDPVIERVLVPGDCTNDQPEVVLANCFTDDFVRLWNDSSRPPAGSPTPE